MNLAIILLELYCYCTGSLENYNKVYHIYYRTGSVSFYLTIEKQ